MDSQFSLRSITGSEPSMASTTERRPLRDNYTPDQICNIKVEQLKHKITDLINLSEMERSFAPDKTGINVSAFVKEKQDYVENVISVLQNSVPSVYPQFYQEAVFRLEEALETSAEEGRSVLEILKKEEQDYDSRTAQLVENPKALNEVISLSDTDEIKDKNVSAVTTKLLQNKFQEAKKDMDYALSKVCGENENMKCLLMDLVEAKDSDEEINQWIEISDKVTLNDLQYFFLTSIIKRHPTDKKKITLII